MAHPKIVATSPTSIVTIPIRASATANAGAPLPMCAGGITAKITFHPIQAKWKRASLRETSSIIRLSSSMQGPSLIASLNY
jgi:hypothetical protein